MTGQKKWVSARTILQLLVFIVLVPFLPLLISWKWNWWEAWAYALIGVLGFVLSRLLVNLRHPDLIAERARFMGHKDIKPWDNLLARLVGLGGGLIPMVAGLDARLSWSATDYGLSVELVALFFILFDTDGLKHILYTLA